MTASQLSTMTKTNGRTRPLKRKSLSLMHCPMCRFVASATTIGKAVRACSTHIVAVHGGTKEN